MRIGWWIKGWNSPFPFSAGDIIREPKCLKWLPPSAIPCRKSSSSDATVGTWSAPPLGWIKWNVNASYDCRLSHAAVGGGGFLRDDKGKFMALFSSPIPQIEINFAEVYAILRAIKIYICNARTKESNIIIEFDSANAVQWCLEDSGGPWNLAFPLNYIRNARKSLLNLKIIHKIRDSNHVADCLGNQGLRRDAEFIAWI